MSKQDSLTFDSAYGQISIPFNKLVESSLQFTREGVFVKLKTIGFELGDRNEQLGYPKVIELNFIVDYEAAENILKCMKHCYSSNF
jgi:hypothetical protein